MDTITNPTAIFPFMSAAQDTADTDTATAGCAYICALRSDADGISDQDDESLFEVSQPIGIKSDGEGVKSVFGVCDSKQTKATLSETSNSLLRLSKIFGDPN
jgi:hypothetical protein